MIFTIPNFIRHFLSVLGGGRVEDPLCVLKSVLRHRKMSLKENASCVADRWALSRSINSSRAPAAVVERPSAVLSCHLVAPWEVPQDPLISGKRSCSHGDSVYKAREAKNWHWLPEAGRERENPVLTQSLQEGSDPIHISILDFQTPKWNKMHNKFLGRH